jgi:shikimate dehydrogenase
MSRASARKIDGQTKLMGILGNQIEFTISPVIHNFAANELGQNIVYVPFNVEPSGLDQFLETMWDLGCLGFNVTTPHKKAVAEKISTSEQAVNTVYRGETCWEGMSTDGIGFAKGLERVGRDLSSFERVVFLGNGGAVCSLLSYFQNIAFTPRIAIVRRNQAVDQDLRALVTSSLEFHDLSVVNLSKQLAGAKDETLFVQASSAPIFGDDLASFAPALDDFKGATVDLVYSHPSKLYYKALANGTLAQDGEPMLIEQARASQMQWWGRTMGYEEIVEVIRGRK